MANPVGFLELERVEQKSENPEERVSHYKEFVKLCQRKRLVFRRADAWIVGLLFVIMGAQLTMSFQTSTA